MSDELKRVIKGCEHTVERMLEWCKEGACPICTTAEAGILREQLEQAKAENARLSAAVIVSNASGKVVSSECLMQAENCLRDLLAPTIPLIEELRQAVMYDPYTEDERSATSYEQLPLVRKADKELSRLRSYLPSKEHSDKTTA